LLIVLTPVAYTVPINPDGSFNASLDCNNVSAEYAADEDNISHAGDFDDSSLFTELLGPGFLSPLLSPLLAEHSG
jgi:hypothetical protein